MIKPSMRFMALRVGVIATAAFVSGCGLIEDRFDFRPFGWTPPPEVLGVNLGRVTGRMETGRAEFTYRASREQLCFSQKIDARAAPATAQIRVRRPASVVLTFPVDTSQVTGNGIPSYWLSGCVTASPAIVDGLRARARDHDLVISGPSGSLSGRLYRKD